MGLTASTEGTASGQKSRLEYLGDRYPFGDAEIIRLARCHAFLRKGRRVRKSFLSDWAVYCASLPPYDANGAGGQSQRRLQHQMHPLQVQHDRQRRAALLQVVEGRMLPSGFGRRLERAAFLLTPDVIDYRTSSTMDDEYEPDESMMTATASPTPRTDITDDPYASGNSVVGGDANGLLAHLPCQPCWTPGHGAPPAHESGRGHSNTLGDEYAHDPKEEGQLGNPLAGSDLYADSFRRLEKFMEGASDCCRRGPRPALTVLFKSCSRNSRGGYTSDMRYGTTAGVSGVSSSSEGGFGSINDPSNLRANANEVLDLGYSLALSSALLAVAAEVENLQDLDANAYIPEDLGTVMCHSLLSYAQQTKRDIHSGIMQSDVANGELNLDPFTGKDLSATISNEVRMSERSMGAGSVSSTSTHVHGNENLVTLDVFLEWAEQCAPCLSACLSTFLHHVLFPDRPYPPSRTPFLYPELGGQSSAFFDQPSNPLLFSLACMSPSLGGAWHRLYTSESDGLSFNRLFSCLLGYGGPTLLIIREVEGDGIFGAFTGTAWKESKDFYGNSDCFLFQLSPSVGVYRPRGRETNFMYCNSNARSRGYDGLAHGIGFGGSNELPRLFIAETFDGCMASCADLTFESGPLLPPAKEGGSRKYFDICDLEVWGVGGDEVVANGLDARKAQRAIISANIQKARKVDKAQFLDDFKSGLIESKAFKHRTEARGRHDFQADDNEKKGYTLPAEKRGSTFAPSRIVPGTGL